MAARRARIQIKPNTGPRVAGSTTKGNIPENITHTPPKPAQSLVKDTAVPPVKSIASSSKTVVPEKPAHISSVQPTPQLLDKTKTLTPIRCESQDSKTESQTSKGFIESPVKETLQLGTAPAKLTENVNSTSTVIGSNSKEAAGIKSKTPTPSNSARPKANDASGVNEKDRTAGDTAIPPAQRARFKKPQPKVLASRKLTKATGKETTSKEVKKTNPPSTDTTATATISTRTTVADEKVQILSQLTSGPEAESGPEVPKSKEKPASKGPSSSVEDSVNCENAVVAVYKTNASRKPKPKDSEGKKYARKVRTEFKQTEPPDRAKMTMMDLIHWNPINNPMKRANELARLAAASRSEEEEEEAVDDPGLNNNKTSNGMLAVTEKETRNDIIPGPRVVVGEDGQITIDESSLVIQQTAPEKDLSEEVLYETSDTTYSSYSKKITTRKLWSMKETAMFYKALSVVGSDFALMANFFPKRDRADLKRKFKKEERTRRDLLDKAMCEWHNFDLEDIQDFLFLRSDGQPEDERNEEERVDDPSATANGKAKGNTYVKENLLNRGPKRKGKQPAEGKTKKSKNDKTNGSGKEKKRTTKRPPSRNLWSDEEAEPVDDALMINYVEQDDESIENEAAHDDSCDCCQLKTKTSERQKSLELKKIIQEEKGKAKQREENAPTSPVAWHSPSNEPLPSTVSFSVVSSVAATPPRPRASVVLDTFRSPPTTPVTPSTTLINKQNEPSGTPRRTYSSPKRPTVIITSKTAGTTTNSNSNKPSSGPYKVNKTPVISKPNKTPPFILPDTITPHITVVSNPKISVSSHTSSNPSKTPSTSANTNPQSSTSGPSKLSTSIPFHPKNIMSATSTASPVLQALLNKGTPLRASFPNSPGGIANQGQFLLVADKTPNNEQVLHVYLVSPQTSTSQNQQPSTSSNRAQASADVLKRLGITQIVQKPKDSDPSSEKKS